MTRGRRHKRTCRRVIPAFLAVIAASIAIAVLKGSMGQQEGQKQAENGRNVKGIFGRMPWMFKVKDCRHVCLFCEYYGMCRADGIPGKEEKAR